MKSSGYYIAFDGIDGTGKSTQVKLLQEALEDRGFEVFVSAEPGGTPQGDVIREVLISKQYELDPITETLLFYADRMEHQLKKIMRLKQDQVLIVDRFASATFAYQFHANGLDKDLAYTLYKLVVKRPPDILLLMELDPKVALERSMKKLNGYDLMHQEGKFESRGLRYFEKVIEGYRLFAEEHNYVVKVNADRPPKALSKEILQLVVNSLDLRPTND